MSKFYGYTGATELPAIKRVNPRTGTVIITTWKGRPSAIDIIEADVIANSLPYERRAAGPGGYQIISIEYGAEITQDANVPLVDLWDRDVNDVQKSIWSAPLVKAELNKLYVTTSNVIDETKLAYLVRFKADIEALARGEVVTFIPTTGEVSGVPLTLSGILQTLGGLGVGVDLEVIKKLFYDLSIGEDSYVQSQFVLRHRRIVLKGTTLKPDDTNTDCVFSTTTFLRSHENVPNDLPFNLPDAMWLKKAIPAAQLDSNKWTFTTEYYAAPFWSILGYPDAA